MALLAFGFMFLFVGIQDVSAQLAQGSTATLKLVSEINTLDANLETIPKTDPQFRINEYRLRAYTGMAKMIKVQNATTEVALQSSFASAPEFLGVESGTTGVGVDYDGVKFTKPELEAMRADAEDLLSL